MKSIRAQLLWWLLPGFVAVCLAAGIAVYVSAEHGMEAELDNRLRGLAGSARMAMANLPRTPGASARPRRDDWFNARPEFSDADSGHYFQIWNESGATVRKSPSLGAAELNRPPETPREGLVYDSTLPDGGRVRVRAFRGMGLTAGGATDVAVALSKREMDSRLARLSMQLALGGLACCAVLAGLLAVAIKVALRPLHRVGERVAQMDAASLRERLREEDVPEEISPVVARLNQLLARLEQSFERERRFSGDLAHELRTPLAAIRSTGEVAAKWPEQASTEDFQEIAQTAARLQQTVDSLLSLARLESSAAGIARERTDVATLAGECAALQADLAKQRGVTVTRAVEAGRAVETDPRLLRIILANMTANAVEYAPAGSEVVIGGGDADVILQVANRAPNLTAADLPHLFERLWRKDSARTDGNHAGLGLSIAHAAAEALGFTLTAELGDDGVLRMTVRAKK
ncbi:MAG: ATP-binding protein [Chthoniobacteraceae bacterium]